MKFNFLTDSALKTPLTTFAKTAALSLTAALLLTACGDKGATTTSVAAEGRAAHEVVGDHAMGSIDAPITLVEYASVTCPHCGNWFESVFPDLRTKYINTGKVRYVFREFPTNELSTPGHLLTNCVPEDKFFDVLHLQFKNMKQINYTNNVKGEFLKIAKSAGLNETQFEACFTNEAEIDRLNDVLAGGQNAGVTGTPTFFINGKKAPTGTYELEKFDAIFAEFLGEAIPEAPTKSETAESEASGH